MEKYEELKDMARRKVTLADHMLTMTFPMVKDTKLLLIVLENVFLAMTNAMSSVLYYERLYKRVPAFTDNFENKISLFKEKCLGKFNFNPEHMKALRDMKELIVEHRKSPIEFVRNDRFIICSDNYVIKSVGVEQIKGYIAKAKDFIQQTEFVVSKNERIFR
jgi:hypothetical protein